MHSPVGDLSIFADGGRIVALDWGWVPDQQPGNVTRQAKLQLDEYFDGERSTFDVPLHPSGTPFQKSVWEVMQTISMGQTLTYGDVAEKLGSAARAVGTACGANPIPILIPCHRILGAGRKITGYSGEGGSATKKALLVLEGALPLESKDRQADQLNLL